MMKRTLALLLSFLMLLTALPVLAEEDDVALTAEQEAEIRALDEVDEEEEVWEPLGPMWEEPTPADFTKDSPALYTCKIMAQKSVFVNTYAKSEDARYADRVMQSRSGITKAEVLYVGQTWAIVRVKQGIGYIKRDFIYDCEPLDTVNTEPYGVQKATYMATTAVTCSVRKSMHPEEESWVVLNPGTLITIWRIIDGWAVVPYWRTFGYIDMNELTDLIPVSPTEEPLRADTPIAAYTSYYSMADNEANLNRIVNISVACERLSRTMKSGESLDFNTSVGPFKKQNGYMPAPVLVSGTTKNNYGGGTCQVSSTLYNALIQIGGVKIIMRRPHGPAGAKYLPHGVDAAVGNSQLNLKIRNDYSFPIRIEGHSTGDGALTMLVYRAD